MGAKCKTCPFREGSPYAFLAPDLQRAAMRTGSRICHSTGSNAINITDKPERLCRGARDYQLRFFHGIGFLREPTDKAWEQKCRELGLR
jgi:hypothetical protein